MLRFIHIDPAATILVKTPSTDSFRAVKGFIIPRNSGILKPLPPLDGVAAPPFQPLSKECVPPCGLPSKVSLIPYISRVR
ncbi:MAG: hypothetical protein NZM65_07080, partial [Flavobacteriales bacterium]|nr:hypothetical protein [Flavobacteriales bacterium]MDW8410436.1 hypothetical protein [Flavobacteriales bacterium]